MINLNSLGTIFLTAESNQLGFKFLKWSFGPYFGKKCKKRPKIGLSASSECAQRLFIDLRTSPNYQTDNVTHIIKTWTVTHIQNRWKHHKTIKISILHIIFLNIKTNNHVVLSTFQAYDKTIDILLTLKCLRVIDGTGFWRRLEN